MVKSSTLVYIVDNTKEIAGRNIIPVNEFMDETDSFLASLFSKTDMRVDNKLVDKILSII